MHFHYIYDEEHENKWRAHARKHFEDFVAKYVLKNDIMDVVDWRHKDGRFYYSVRFVVDKKVGSLYVSGDLGEGMFQINSDNTSFKEWAHFGLEYLAEKLRCSTEQTQYGSEDFFQDFLDHAGICQVDDDLDVFIRSMAEQMENNENGSCIVDTDLEDKLDTYAGSDWHTWLCDCGRRFPPRIIAWEEAMKMAAAQLEEKTMEELVAAEDLSF